MGRFLNISVNSNHLCNIIYLLNCLLYSWSFVLEMEASADVIKQVDGPKGYGRVKNAKHWMAVPLSDWRHPYGPDSNIYQSNKKSYPVVHVSYKDAKEYCLWAGRRLPTEKEWEYASRGGLVNKTYPWDDTYDPKSDNQYKMNVFDGEFPHKNTKLDGYEGIAPVYSYEPNKYGVYNTVGNVWERVEGGTHENRIIRGGSYMDSIDGSFNHPVMVSTRQENSGDSAASNSGFRCATSGTKLSSRHKADKTKLNDDKQDDADHTNRDHHIDSDELTSSSTNVDRIEL